MPYCKMRDGEFHSISGARFMVMPGLVSAGREQMVFDGTGNQLDEN